MAALVWDKESERLYETGVDHGVLYVKDSNGNYGTGVVWNGLTAVNESPEGGEPNPLWADNIKYLNLMSAEEFGGSIEAYTYPDEFMECDGTKQLVAGVYVGQQSRKEFGLCYRTKIGNDTDGEDHGYKIHLVYGCLASPTDKGYETINDSPNAITFSWDFTTTPVACEGMKPVSHLVIDSTKFTEQAAKAKFDAFLETLYGNDETGQDAKTASLPLPDDVKDALD